MENDENAKKTESEIPNFQSLGQPQNARERFLVNIIDRYRIELARQHERAAKLAAFIDQMAVELIHLQSLVAVLAQDNPNLVSQITFGGFPAEEGNDNAIFIK
jgi:hypothetical protein